jgi:hypothetical protein
LWVQLTVFIETLCRWGWKGGAILYTKIPSSSIIGTVVKPEEEECVMINGFGRNVNQAHQYIGNKGKMLMVLVVWSRDGPTLSVAICGQHF